MLDYFFYDLAIYGFLCDCLNIIRCEKSQICGLVSKLPKYDGNLVLRSSCLIPIPPFIGLINDTWSVIFRQLTFLVLLVHISQHLQLRLLLQPFAMRISVQQTFLMEMIMDWYQLLILVRQRGNQYSLCLFLSGQIQNLSRNGQIYSRSTIPFISYLEHVNILGFLNNNLQRVIQDSTSRSLFFNCLKKC